MDFPLEFERQAALRQLIRSHGERGTPFAFAGRREILEEIAGTIEANKEHPQPGQTFILNGPPGAGKTAILEQLAKEWKAGRVILMKTPPKDHQVEGMWLRIAEHFLEKGEDEIRADIHTTHSKKVSLNTPFSVEWRHTKESTSPAASIDSCEDIKNLAHGKTLAPLIVCIDEIQDTRKDTVLADFLKELHTQKTLPVLLVCAGLSNSTLVLNDVAISRPVSRHVLPIGQLNAEEAREVTEKSLAVIASEAGLSKERLIGHYALEIAEASDHWPIHLTCYLHGLCEALIAHLGPDLSSLTTQDVLAYGNNLREAYYRDRLKASKMPLQDVVTLYDEVRRDIDEDDCIDLLQACLDKSEKTKFKNTFHNGEEVFNQVLRSGILNLGRDDRCEIPIPSMETFIRKEARARQPRAISQNS